MIIQEYVALNDKNWFKTGGTARFFCEPSTIQEMQYTCAWAQEHNQPIFILGEGANILINDEGCEGLIIRPQLKDIAVADYPHKTVHVTVGAGLSMDALIEWCLSQRISGLEEFSGIPGTVGGSVYINLHYYQFLLEQFLLCARVLDVPTGQVQDVAKQWFKFGYNQSELQRKQHILLEATFVLKRVSVQEVAYARGRRIEIIRHRMARYPHKNTCGSFFRNFTEDEVVLEAQGKKIIYVAYYLDKAGVRGALQVGGAMVSYQHANMIINMGQATSNDIIELARCMQQKVHEIYGIVPQPECQLLGFSAHPLLT